MHPFIKFRRQHPYVHVTLEDTRNNVVHWDAVYNMQDQYGNATKKTLFGKKIDPSYGYTLQ